MSAYTQDSTLYCRTKKGQNGRTIIESMFFTPPLKLLTPIYENDVANLMLLNVSAGLMEGDKQEICFEVGKDSALRLTSQSYEKIHNTQEGRACRNTTLHLAEHAFLSYMPLPCIPFANSSFHNTTTIYLHEDSILHYAEIFCAGRVGRGEIFAFKHFYQNLRIYKNNALLLYDTLNLTPDSMNLGGICAFSRYTHYLHIVLYDKDKDEKELQKILASFECNAAISTNNGIIIIKALANGSEELFLLQKKLGL